MLHTFYKILEAHADRTVTPLTVINDNNMLLDLWTYLTTDYALIGEL
jgi:hypothetical protein